MIHHNWEIAIDQNRIVDDSELQRTIYNALRDNPYQRNRCLDIANILSRSALGRQQTCHVATLSGRLKSRNSAKPIVDLNLGLKASYVVTESVLSSKTHRTLEAQLRNAHSQHLACMNTSEIESSNQIIQHVKERDHLINNKDTGAGAASKIKNWVAGVQIGFKDRAITSEYSNYICRKHLTNIAESYGQVINEKVQLYGNWYICSAPPLNIDVVKRDLLPIQEIARVTGATEQSIKDLLKNSDVHSFSIGNHELIRRPDMERILSQSTLNGITLGLIEKDKPILL